MNKKLYLGIYLASFLLAAAALFAALLSGLTFAEKHPVMVPVRIVTGIGVVQFLLVAVVYPLVLLAKMWGAIQDGSARTTPGKAVGFLFIPFFNLYWVFNVWAGFPTDYNDYVTRRGLPVEPLSRNLYLAYPILLVLSPLPIIGILSAVASILFLPVLAANVCDTVNRLSEFG
ncbi:MAG: hypothetical protein C4325_13720 [Blastocatellia bacterium]